VQHRGSLAVAAVLLAGTCLVPAPAAIAKDTPRASGDALSAGFANPPNSARPRVWWHWMNGNITKDGIRKDLDWMSRVGIGGLQNFDASLLTPQVVPNRLVYMSPEWKDAFRYAAELADQKGLEFAIASSPGWSETGGPWVKPQDAMKKLVWSETIVEGGRRSEGVLPPPPRVTGPFQDAPEGANILGAPDPNPPTYYADAAVVAYRLPDSPGEAPRITGTNGGSLDGAALADRRASTGVDLPTSVPGAPTSVVIEYPTLQTVRAFTLATALDDRYLVSPRLEAEDGEGHWRTLAEMKLAAAPQTTVSFPAVTARRFRVVFIPLTPPSLLGDHAGAPGAFTDFLPAPAKKDHFRLTELRLDSEPRINQFELKAGFAVASNYDALDAGAAQETGPAPGSVIDLTAKLAPDGKLDWTPPPGRWKVLRLGYSLTGKTNHPATKEATGLEVDKYDAAAVRRYLETYLGMYAGTTGPDLIGRHGVRAFLTDSTEVGPSNWTPAMLADFQRLRGYDPRPWLPVLTGAVIGSTAQSDAFLYDFRRTLGDLMAAEHYGTVSKVAHEHGLTLYGESLEGGRPVLGDDMTMRRYTDIPMSALWTYAADEGPNPGYIGDMKGAASVAHVYGQNLVAAESMTAAFSPWAFAPHDLKKFIDLEFASGVNRPVIHTSVHQPLDKPPGLSLMIFGQYFNRLDTWAEMAKPWVDYMSRSAFLLQQGRNVADVAYVTGEERPLAELSAERALTDLPTGYAYDFFDPGMLLGALSAKGAELVTPGGARYRVLYLGGTSERMTVPVLRRLDELASAGATIVGVRPTSSPSLADDPAEFKSLADRLWSGARVTHVGRGEVIASRDLDATLKGLGVGPDFAYGGAAADRDVLFLHRKLADGDAYFVDNRKDGARKIEARFRVTGRTPELWHAETGRSEPVSYRIEKGETVVPLDLAPFDALFVVFRKPAKAQALSLSAPLWSPAAKIEGPWDVTFQAGRGAPPSTRLSTLAPLNENPQSGVKYFSGVATYRTTFRLPAGARPGRPLMLDLGRVGDLAEVVVNGKPVGAPWKAPFRVDVGRAVRTGDNSLEVRVADLWVNRLIGDQQPGAQKITFTTLPTYKADAPLRPAGLMGPVELLTTKASAAR
jgi:hypothetical protein